LVLEPFIPGDELVQVDATTVYDQLITDLETSEENLPISYPASDVGRATKGASATLLSKVLLTKGQNAIAEVVLRRIIDNYGYGMVENYKDIWGVSNENNLESIFEVQFQGGGIGQGSAFTNEFSPSSFLQTGFGFGRNRPTQALINSFDSEDERFGASIGTSYINEQGEETLADFVRKYESDPSTENDSDINFIVFRYADVLLMLAEAIGESNESYQLINDVRERAGLPEIDSSTPGTFNEKILEERQLELAFENHRWADLKRFNSEKEVFEVAEPLVNPAVVRELFFIPQREMDINPNFVQNTN
jgi:hypothetical protein